MTAQSKTTIKSYFETGDKPSAAQFIDFIDSYVDTGSAVTALTGDVTLGTVANGTAVATIASAAVTGTKLEARSVSLAKMGFGTVGQIYYCDVSGVPSLLAAGTSGQSLQMIATIPAWVSAASTTSIYPNNGYAANRYYHGLGYYPSGSNMTVVAGRLYWRPMIIGASFTATKVGMHVTTFAAGNCRMGLYTMTDGLPDALVADFGTVSTGTNGEKEITISQALTPGVYAIAEVFDATPAVEYINGENGVMTHFIGETADIVNDNGGYKTFAYAALPATFGANTAYTTNGSNPCNMWFRK